MSDKSKSSEPKPSKSNRTVESASGNNRRRLLKALAGSGTAFAAGSVALKAWKQPVVNSIVLPAHATLTCGSVQSYAGGAMLNLNLSSLMDSIMPRAYGAVVSTMATAELCIQCNGNGRANVRVAFTTVSPDEPSCTAYPYFERNDIPLGETKSLNLMNCEDGFAARILIDGLNGSATGKLFLDTDVFEFITFKGGFTIGAGKCDIDIPECVVCAEGP